MGSHIVQLVSILSALVFLASLNQLVGGVPVEDPSATNGQRVFKTMEEVQNYAKKFGKNGDQYLLENADGKRQLVTLSQKEIEVAKKKPVQVKLRVTGVVNVKPNGDIADGSNGQALNVNSNEGTVNQNTFLDKLNNFNLQNYATVSKTFKKTQDHIENFSYAAPLGGYVGPLVTVANLMTGFINQKNDNLIGRLYNGVRYLFGLKGTVVTPDFNHLPEAKPVVKKHDTQATKSKLDELENLF